MEISCNRYLNILKSIDINLYNASILTLKTPNDRQDSIIFQTSASMSGPLLYSYVSWVLIEAQRKNIKRLYFLARDGYVMLSIAKIICEYNNIDIECKYLYCSRYAWRIPQYHLLGNKCIDKICLGGIDVTLNKIFDRARLTENEKISVCQMLNIKTEQMKIVLSRKEITSYKYILLQCEPFMNYVYKHSLEAYNLTILYFEQEGLFDKILYGIVDTGWTGSMQESLLDILKSKETNIESPYGFYYGLYDIPNQMMADRYLTFSFSKNKGLKRKVYFNNNVLECICCSTDGMTTGYRKKKSKVIPDMETKFNINKDVWDIDIQIETIILFAKNAVKKVDFKNFCYKDSIKIADKLCKLFMIYPTDQEALVYSQYKFSDDITEKNLNNLALHMTKKELSSNLLFNRILTILDLKNINRNNKESCWIEGSIVISDCIYKRWYLLNAQLFKWMRYIKQIKLLRK